MSLLKTIQKIKDILAKDAWEDKMPGGKADKKKPSDFPEDALAEGIKVEMEHTDDPKVAKEVAMDHLSESPLYYKELKRMESRLEKAENKNVDLTPAPLTPEEIDTEFERPIKEEMPWRETQKHMLKLSAEPNLQERHIQGLIHLGKEDGPIAESIMKHPKIGPEHLHFVLDSTAGAHHYSFIASEHPGLQPEHISKMLDRGSGIASRAIQHPNASPENLKDAIEGDWGSDSVPIYAARHPNLTHDLFKKVLADGRATVAVHALDAHPDYASSEDLEPYLTTSRGLYSHPKITGDQLLRSLKEDAGNSEDIYKNPKLTAEHLNTITEQYPINSISRYTFTAPNLNDKHLRTLIDRGFYDPKNNPHGIREHDMHDAVRHKLVSPETLNYALDKYKYEIDLENPPPAEHRYLRMAIARSKQATPEILNRIYKEGDPEAIDDILGNENVPHSIINDFISKEDLPVKDLAALVKNNTLTSEQITKLYNHPDVPYGRKQDLLELKNAPADLIIANHMEPSTDETQTQKPIEVTHNSHKLRKVRDIIDDKGGTINKRDLEKLGYKPADLGITHLLDSKGNVKSEDIHKHIQGMPKAQYAYTHDAYGDQPEEQDWEPPAISWDDALEHGSIQDIVPEDTWQEAIEDAQDAILNNFQLDTPENWDEMSEDEQQEEEDRQRDQFYDDNSENIYDRAERSIRRNYNPNEIVHDHILEAAQGEQEPPEPDYDSALSEQRHSTDLSDVFQLNLHPEQIKALHAKGLWGAFKKLEDISKRSSHPVGKNGLGWVRYTGNTDSGIHIDEMQSDLGSGLKRTVAKIKKDVQQNPEKADQRAIAGMTYREVVEQFSDDVLDGINKIVFNNLTPSQVLHDSFHQYLRNQGAHNTPVHVWQARPKSKISGMTQGEKLPVHMTEGYQNEPKKMGYEPAQYGQLDTQHNPGLKGQDTWSEKIRKTKKTPFLSTLEKIKKALGGKVAGQDKLVKSGSLSNILADVLEKAYSVNGRFLPNISDIGKPHPHDETQVGHKSKTGEPVWRQNDRITKKHALDIQSGYGKLGLSKEHDNNLRSLIRHVGMDPDNAAMSSGTTPGSTGDFNELRIRHISGAINDRDGMSLTPLDGGVIQIHAKERHSTNPKNPYKQTTWHWDGKKLKSFSKDPISGTTTEGEHDYERAKKGLQKGRTDSGLHREELSLRKSNGSGLESDGLGVGVRQGNDEGRERRRSKPDSTGRSAGVHGEPGSPDASRLQKANPGNVSGRASGPGIKIPSIPKIGKPSSTGTSGADLHNGPKAVSGANKRGNETNINKQGSSNSGVSIPGQAGKPDAGRGDLGAARTGVSKEVGQHKPVGVRGISKLVRSHEHNGKPAGSGGTPGSTQDNNLAKGANGDWTKESGYKTHYHYAENPNTGVKLHQYYVTHDSVGHNDPHKNAVASATFFSGQDESDPEAFTPTVFVNKEHQRKGIASSLYKRVQAEHGIKLIPDTMQSQDAKALWSQPDRPFGKSSLEKSISADLVYVAMDGDSAGSQVERAARQNDIEKAKDISQRILKGSAAIVKAAKKLGAEIVISGGDDSGFLLPKSKISEIESIRKVFFDVAGFTITAGYGSSIPNAIDALLWGKLHGKDQTVEWSKDKSDFVNSLGEMSEEEKILSSNVLTKSLESPQAYAASKLKKYKRFNRLAKNAGDYRGQHTAPGPEDAPMHDLSGTFPADVYSHDAARLYGHGVPYDSKAVSVIHGAKGNPNAKVKIYRAVPKTQTNAEKIQELDSHKKHILKTGKIPSGAWPASVGGWRDSSHYYDFASDMIDSLKGRPEIESKPMTINSGDWVTTTREYAKEHGEGAHGKGKYVILSKVVPASHVHGDGSIHEWGYNPPEKPKRGV